MSLDTLKQHLKKFEEFEKAHPGPISTSLHFKGSKKGPHIVFSGLIHGNEVGSLPAFLRLAEDIHNKKIQIQGELTLVLGNIKAALVNERFTEEDLNRAFSHFHDKTHESRRAQELARVIESCDLYIDYHQTIQPTRGAFYLFSESDFNIKLASYLFDSPWAIVRSKSAGLAYEQMTSGEYAESKKIPSLTLELSQKGFFTEAEDLCYSSMTKILSIFDGKEITTQKIPEPKNNLKLLKNSYKEKFSHPAMTLKEGLINFDQVSKGTLLGYDSVKNSLLAPVDGYLLFPKYPKRVDGLATSPLPSDIFVIVY